MKTKPSNRTINFAKALFIAALIASVIAVLSACSTPEIIGKGYSTFIEREKDSEFKKFTSLAEVDSVVHADFGYAARFNADSIFSTRNLFTIENETNFIYIEQKNLVQRFRYDDDIKEPVGKIKFKTIRE